jgi:predicted MPP superfamily phosphohydrolase
VTGGRPVRRTNIQLFFFGMLFVFVALSIYVPRRGWQALSGTGALRPVALAVYLAFFASIFLGRILRSRTGISEVLNAAGSFYIGFFAVVLVLVLFVDLLRLIDHFAPFFPAVAKSDPRRAGRWAFAAVAGLAAILVLGGWIHALRIKLKTVEIALDKPASGLLGLEAAFVSDIHLGTLLPLSRLEKIVSMINALRPDIVFIAGDVMNEEMSDADLDRMAETLRKIESRYGVFACPGNHEYYAKLERSLPALRRGGVDVLQDEFRIVANAFTVVGRGNTQYLPAMEKRKPLGEILAGADLGRPVILLDHQPARLADSAAAGADLQLSGHTHAGQLIPYAWINRALWDVGYGYGRIGRMQVYVTSGAGVWGPPVRIGTHSEIVRLKIAFQTAKGEPSE